MRMLFSQALEFGSIIFRHGVGGTHRHGDLSELCAVEAALAAAGRRATVSVCGRDFDYCNIMAAAQEWPYLLRPVPPYIVAAFKPTAQFYKPTSGQLLRQVWQLNDQHVPRGYIVDLVRHYEILWGIEAALELPAPQPTTSQEGDTVCVSCSVKR